MATQVFSKFYTYKKTGTQLSTDNEFLTMAKGTVLIKSTGEEFTKISSNIFDKTARTHYSLTEADQIFAAKQRENTFTRDNFFNSNVNVDKTLTASNLIVQTSANISNLTVPDNLYTKNITNSNKITTEIETVNDTLISPLIVPQTDSSGTIGTASLKFNEAYINTMHGISTSALYSDLAEKYTTDKHYDEGTVMEFDETKRAELTEFKSGNLAGVISYNPGLKINAGQVGGQYVCLKGKVPVKCLSEIKRGQFCIASNGKVYGVDKGNISFEESLKKVGIALEDWDSETRTVMVKI